VYAQARTGEVWQTCGYEESTPITLNRSNLVKHRTVQMSTMVKYKGIFAPRAEDGNKAYLRARWEVNKDKGKILLMNTQTLVQERH